MLDIHEMTNHLSLFLSHFETESLNHNYVAMYRKQVASPEKKYISYKK